MRIIAQKRGFCFLFNEKAILLSTKFLSVSGHGKKVMSWTGTQWEAKLYTFY